MLAILKRIVKSKYPYLESNLDVITTVRSAPEYSYASKGVAVELKKERLGQV
jgi:exosome complex exonuclease RRP6